MQRLGRRGGAALTCLLLAMVVACGGSSSSSGGTDGEGDGETSGNGTSGNGTSGNGTSGNGTSGNGNSTSGTTGGVTEGEPIAIEDYPGAVGGVICDWIAPCCGDLGLPVTQSQCVTVLSGAFAGDVGAADPQNYTYDPELAGDCIASARMVYAQIGCDLGNVDPEVGADVDATCDNIFKGKLAPGEACVSDVECAAAAGESATCDDVFSDSPRCVVEWRAEAGEDCYWTCTEESNGSTSCSGGGGDVPARQGQCFTNDGLSCANGTCEATPELGDPCTLGEQCTGGYCSSETETCTAPVGEGETCVSDDWCEAGLYCDAQSCAPLSPDGAACTVSQECASGFCEEGSCVEDQSDDLGLGIICAAASGQL